MVKRMWIRLYLVYWSLGLIIPNALLLCNQTNNIMKKIFVPRWVDQANTNAQISNAKAMLSRFSNPNVQWTALNYETPDPAVAVRSNVQTRQAHT